MILTLISCIVMFGGLYMSVNKWPDPCRFFFFTGLCMWVEFWHVWHTIIVKDTWSTRVVIYIAGCLAIALMWMWRDAFYIITIPALDKIKNDRERDE
jgi:hypothetical protein